MRQLLHETAPIDRAKRVTDPYLGFSDAVRRQLEVDIARAIVEAVSEALDLVK